MIKLFVVALALYSSVALAQDNVTSVFDKFISACDKYIASNQQYDQASADAQSRCQGRSKCLEQIDYSAFSNAAKLKENSAYYEKVANLALPVLDKNKNKLTEFNLIDIKKCSRHTGAGTKAFELMKKNQWLDW